MCRPSASGDHWSSAAPSNRTLPRTGCHAPTINRAKDDFPEALGPMMARPSPLLSAKVDILQARPADCRGASADGFDGQRPAMASATASGCLRIGQHQQELIQTLIGLARSDEAFPIGDGELDRRERPRDQDRARDDHASGRLLIDHEISAEAEHQRLHIRAARRGTPRPSIASAIGDAALGLRM